MLRRILLLMLVPPLALPMMVACRAGLINPGPIAVPTGLIEQEIVTAIKSSLSARIGTAGKSWIHDNDIGWINNLTAGISRNMQQMSMD
jgi:hypothetical protein